MNTALERFKLSCIPKQRGVDNTDEYKSGMKISFFNNDKNFIIIDILSQYDLTVIELGIMH